MTDDAWRFLSWFGGALWFGAALRSFLSLRHLDLLSEQIEATSPPWPRVSLIVAAKNEAETLAPALETLARIDYPELEIVLVNDRSTDETGEIMERMAERDPKFRVVHISALPEGWLGKTHANEQARKHAQGEWLLFTDADVHFASQALRKAISYARQRELDHLTLFPDMVFTSWVMPAISLTGLFLASLRIRYHAVSTSSLRDTMGIGAFNLVKASTLNRTEGIEWIKMELAEDIGLALLIKRSGGRSGILSGVGQISINWYPTWASLIRGLATRAIAMTNYSWARACIVMGLAPLLIALPGLPWALEPSPSRFIWGLMAYLLPGLVAGLFGKRLMGISPWYGVLLPAGVLFLAFMVGYSAVLCAVRGGISWRNTLYPLSQLRASQRVKF